MKLRSDTGGMSVDAIRERTTRMGECTDCDRHLDIYALLAELATLKGHFTALEVNQSAQHMRDLVQKNGGLRDENERLQGELKRMKEDLDGARQELSHVDKVRARALTAERALEDVRCALENVRREWQNERAEHACTRAKLALTITKLEDVWLWQGDGQDDLKSLVCPVVMSAETAHNLQERATYVAGTNVKDGPLPSGLRETVIGGQPEPESCAASVVNLGDAAPVESFEEAKALGLNPVPTVGVSDTHKIRSALSENGPYLLHTVGTLRHAMKDLPDEMGIVMEMNHDDGEFVQSALLTAEVEERCDEIPQLFFWGDADAAIEEHLETPCASCGANIVVDPTRKIQRCDTCEERAEEDGTS